MSNEEVQLVNPPALWPCETLGKQKEYADFCRLTKAAIFMSLQDPKGCHAYYRYPDRTVILNFWQGKCTGRFILNSPGRPNRLVFKRLKGEWVD